MQHGQQAAAGPADLAPAVVGAGPDEQRVAGPHGQLVGLDLDLELAREQDDQDVALGLVPGVELPRAERFAELGTVPGTAGFMLNFDDFLDGVEIFGSEVMPLLA